MKNRDKVATEALRMIKSEIGYKKLEKGSELDDKELTALLASLEKKWADAIAQFEKGGRQDLVDMESAKLEVLRRYLPKKLSDEQLTNIVDETLREIGAESKADFGDAMKAVMEKVRGQADGKKVKEIVSARLSS